MRRRAWQWACLRAGWANAGAQRRRLGGACGVFLPRACAPLPPLRARASKSLGTGSTPTAQVLKMPSTWNCRTTCGSGVPSGGSTAHGRASSALARSASFTAHARPERVTDDCRLQSSIVPLHSALRRLCCHTGWRHCRPGQSGSEVQDAQRCCNEDKPEGAACALRYLFNTTCSITGGTDCAHRRKQGVISEDFQDVSASVYPGQRKAHT